MKDQFIAAVSRCSQGLEWRHDRGTKFEIGLALENILNTKWNEAQFATESRLKGEPNPVTELNFTPGTPLFARIKLAVFF